MQKNHDRHRTVRRRIPATLLSWDVIALGMILALVAILFQRLLMPLIIDTAFEDIAARHRRVSGRYILGLDYLDSKRVLPYREGVEILIRETAAEARSELQWPESAVLVHLPGMTHLDLTVDSYGLYIGGRMVFFEESLTLEELNQISDAEGIIMVRYRSGGDRMVGTYSLLTHGIGAGFKRGAEQRIRPMLIMADPEEAFFWRIRRIRLVFWGFFSFILLLILSIKLRITSRAASELNTISREIRERSIAVRERGEVGSDINSLALRFKETNELYQAFGELNGGLSRVGEVLGGIADRDLFIATLKEDSSLLDPHPVPMAVLFLDVQGFTSISETHKSDAMRIVNILWDAVENAVEPRRGKINKFIGDACIAIFLDEAACQRALDAAVEILSAVPMLKQDLDIDFAFRIGLDYGEVTYGKTGSRHNYELGVIGDPVNTAARLEALNKQYGTKILMSQEIHTRAELKDEQLHYYEIDYARPKGKKEAKHFYTLLRETPEGEELYGEPEVLPKKYFDAFRNLGDKFREGIRLWKDGDSAAAAKLWEGIALRYAKLYGRFGFKPAYPYLRSLLKGEDLLKLEANTKEWLDNPQFSAARPDDEWIQLEARELGK